MPDLTELELEHIRQIIFLNEKQISKNKHIFISNTRHTGTTNV